MLPIFLTLLTLSTQIDEIHRRSDSYKIAKELRRQIRGYVFLRGSPDYETARPVHNGLCRDIYPLLIVKPLDFKDVSAAVKMATKNDFKISVRSGGHSYQCLGIKVSFGQWLEKSI